jgi:hypothetical protein
MSSRLRCARAEYALEEIRNEHVRCSMGDLSTCDLIKCECGNTAEDQGFFPSDLDGREVPPALPNVDELIQCDRCKAIFNARTGACVRERR